MRLVKAALCLFCAIAAGCSQAPRPGAADDPRDLCRFVVRGAVDPVAMTWADGGVSVLVEECASNRCFVGNADGVATQLPDGRMRLRIGTHDVVVDGEPTPPFPKASRGAFLLGGRAAAVLGAQGLTVLLARDPVPLHVKTPALAANETLTGLWATGGGVLASTSVSVDGGCGEEPGRSLWLVPPAGAVADIRPGTWPVFRLRSLQGFIVPTGPGWTYEGLDGTRVVVREGPDPEGEQRSVPSVIVDDDGSISVQDRYIARFYEDGVVVRSFDARGLDVFWLSRRLYVLDPARGVVAVRATGDEVIVPRRPGMDLSGAPWPQGAVFDRSMVVSDWQRALVIVERAITDTCRVDDRIFLVDVEARSVTVLGTDDKLRYAPTIAMGRPAWIEAEATYRTVSSEQ